MTTWGGEGHRAEATWGGAWVAQARRRHEHMMQGGASMGACKGGGRQYSRQYGHSCAWVAAVAVPHVQCVPHGRPPHAPHAWAPS